MTEEYQNRSRSLDDIYALIDKNRAEAAKVAQNKFHSDMEAAIATIASIGSVASARVLADSRVASANVLINAELAATRLLAEAELQASKSANEALTKPKESVQAALSDIGKITTVRLITAARESVEKIQRDAEAAIRILRETGAIAIREIQTLADNVAEQTRHDAELAAKKLKEYREHARVPDEVIAEGEEVAKIIVKAAEDASVQLQDAIKSILAKINKITDEACSAVHKAALEAENKIKDGQERALIRLQETLQTYY